MGEIDSLRDEVAEAREVLLAAAKGIDPEAFGQQAPAASEGGNGWSVADVLWHAGLVEDWLRLAIDQGVGGRAIVRFRPRQRPAIASTPEYLVEWLDQCRRPLLALLRRLPEDALDREFTLPGGETRTARRLVRYLAAHDREHAEQVRALRDLPPRPTPRAE